jgi:hypothetical protein
MDRVRQSFQLIVWLEMFHEAASLATKAKIGQILFTSFFSPTFATKMK